MPSLRGHRLAVRPGFVLITWLLAAGMALALALVIGPARAQTTQAIPVGKPQTDDTAIRALNPATYYTYLPLVAKAFVDPCAPIPGESYDTLPIIPPPTDPPADEHPDINLAIRGYELTDAYKGLVDYTGPGDPDAPQLSGLCNGCAPPFSNVYQAYDWDWENDRRGPLISDPQVTLIGMPVTAGETVHVPDSGCDLGYGYDVLVLYATTERITLKYTREDNVIWGYTLHVEGICVEPALRALYESMNAAGRDDLPALRGGQAIGRARSSEVVVAIRDNGNFMDPRSRKDWWQGW